MQIYNISGIPPNFACVFRNKKPFFQKKATSQAYSHEKGHLPNALNYNVLSQNKWANGLFFKKNFVMCARVKTQNVAHKTEKFTGHQWLFVHFPEHTR